jgi:hypothetical protein
MSLIDKLLNRPDPEQQATEEYNAGLKAKYAGNWKESLSHNQRAAKLNPNDEATWWNLAIEQLRYMIGRRRAERGSLLASLRTNPMAK